ncbi:MAG: MFS transporter [Pseudomonadota bacterium]
MSKRFAVLSEKSYRLFLVGYGISFTLYWVTLLAIGWWTWEMTQSATWVGLMFFCDLFPAVLVTPWAAAIADKGNRFRILRIVLWIQVFTGFLLGLIAWLGWLTPSLLTVFVFIEGLLVGFSQPAFFGLVNRLVSKENLSAAVALNSSLVHTTYVLGPLLAGLIFSFGLEIAPLAFAANAAGTLVYLWALSNIRLQPQQTATNDGSGMGILVGLTVLWKNPVIFGSVSLMLGIAFLQRPLINLAPGINDYYDVFSAAYFTLLTASFMAGSVSAGLVHAARNSDAGLRRLTIKVYGSTLLFYALLFILLGTAPYVGAVAVLSFFILGFGCGFVSTGSIVVLQTRTAENLRSRVLGNSFMLSRTIGAFAVLITGAMIDYSDFPTGLISIAILVAVLTLLFFWFDSVKRNHPEIRE